MTRFHKPPPPRPTSFASVEREIRARGAEGPLVRLKTNGSRTNILRYTKSFAKDPAISEWVVGKPFPKKITQLKATPILKYGSLQNELFWSAAVLRLFAAELNRFVELRTEFSEALLSGDVERAEATLGSIEREFGFSIWTIENRIALFAASSGLERQKDYSSGIVGNKDVASTIRLLTRYLSVRAEQTVSPLRFTRLLNDFLRDHTGLGSSTTQYYRFKLDFFGGHDLVPFLPQILILESNAAIVDRYMTFMKVCQLIVATYSTMKALRVVTDAIDLIRATIRDPSLFNLCAILGLTPPTTDRTVPNAIHTIVEGYTIGDYTATISDAERLLQQHPSLIEVCEIYAKASIRLGNAPKPTVAASVGILIGHFRSILLLDEFAPASVTYLLTLATVNASHAWAAQIYSFLMQEYRHDRGKMAERLVLFGELNSYPGNPRLYAFAKRASFPTSYPAHIENRKLSPKAHHLMDILANPRQGSATALEELGLPEKRLLKYTAKLLNDRGNYTPALEIYRTLLVDPGSVTYYENLLPAVRCFLSAGKLEEAIKLTAAAYLNNRNVAARLPIEDLVDRLETHSVFHFGSLIELPILYDLYYRTYSGAKELERADACEDFIAAQRLRRPSLFRSIASAFDRVALIYFLRNVCVPQVLDCSVEYQGTEDVQQERIAVLQYLLEIDSNRADDYSNEIRALTTSLTVARGLREVEQSRIYVDVPGVKRTVEEVLRDSYVRYIDLLKHTSDSYSTESLVLALKSLDALEGAAISVYIPADEKFALFRSMVTDIRDKFVSSNEYGLDSSLSMGFRHGTLSGQLRPQLEAAHLITLKDSKTNSYRQNEYWAALLQDDTNREKILQRLGQFSAEVDGLIDDINGNTIQVHTESRPKQGMFDFSISPLFVKALQIRIKPETTFDDFFGNVVTELWTRTDGCLQAIRSYVLDALTPAFSKLFDALSSDLRSLSSAALQPIFDTITQAKIDTQYNLDRIRSWFSRTTADEAADYHVRLPIEIGLATVHNVYLEQPIKPICDLDETLKFKGKTLTALTNIMFTLFDNIRKYAAPDGGKREFTCSVRKREQEVVFTITNEIPNDIDARSEDANLNEIRDAIGSAMVAGRIAGDKVKREGRSGFYKIGKILMFELGSVGMFEFGFNKDGAFRVEFAIPKRLLLA
jgi:hypothetical protein